MLDVKYYLSNFFLICVIFSKKTYKIGRKKYITRFVKLNDNPKLYTNEIMKLEIIN